MAWTKSIGSEEMTQWDFLRLREVGYSDQETVDIVHVADWFSYVNLITQGLGTELIPALRDKE